VVTRRGWLLLAATFALIVCGRILGIAELFGLAVAGVAALVVARVQVARGAGDLAVTARVSPPVAHIGELAKLELHIHNRGRRRSRAVLLRPTPHRGYETPIVLSEIAVPPLAPGEEGKVVVALPTSRRGSFELAGISADLEDPLGLAVRRAPLTCQGRLVVLPVMEQLEDVAPFNSFAGNDEAIRSTASRLLSGHSSFRSYGEGDDLRLVHWKTTARVGELMVREGGDPEAPESLSVTVVLDCRRSPHTAETFETAVSVAASVIDTSTAIGAAVRLVTTSGADTGFGSDDAHLEEALIELAVAQTRSDAMNRSLDRGGEADPGTGLLVAVTTTRASERDVDALLSARRARTPLLVLVRDASATGAAELAHNHVEVVAGRSVRAAWVEAFGQIETLSSPLDGPAAPSLRRPVSAPEWASA
jgi:uncharacterized protein (DUF58 family)